MSKRNLKWLLPIVLLVFLLASCGGGQDESTTATPGELTEVLLPLGYIPNIQFAPLYVALDKGYFAEAGFEVQFDYRFETDGVALVGQGELPFAVVSGEQVLLARSQGIPVQYVASWFQGFPVGVVAKADSGIVTPADLAGRDIGIPGLYGASYIGIRALLSSAGVDPEEVTLESIGFNQVEALASDQVEAAVVYMANEPVQLQARGYPVNEIAVADYVNLVANGIITNEGLIREDPEMVQRFVDAFLHGLADTISDPEEAYQISLAYVEGLKDADKDIQMEVLMRSIAFWEAEPLGRIDPEGWENMLDVLLEMEILGERVPADEAYSTRFVD